MLKSETKKKISPFFAIVFSILFQACSGIFGKYAAIYNHGSFLSVVLNIFYFEKHDVRKVYYRTTKELQARHYFKLPRNVVDLDGVTRAAENTNKDVAVRVTVPLGWFDWFDPAAFHVRDCEFSFSEAKKVRNR